MTTFELLCENREPNLELVRLFLDYKANPNYQHTEDGKLFSQKINQ